jgi:ribosomal protein L20A (L18A)|tara:strand:- start:745 stop:1755 length:1011 start_codon:yes stop_codon:yes gene_type:complete
LRYGKGGINMGYYTEYFSTLFKGLRITALKQRIEVRRVVNNLRRADHILYKNLFEDVEKSHKVTKAMKEEAKLIKELNISAENVYSLVFNLTTDDLKLLEIVENILKELEAFSKSAGTSNAQLKKVEREFAITLWQALKKAESEDREEFKQVMVIINESEETDPKKFMATLRLAFQTEKAQTLLAKFAARQEIRRIKVDILKLQEIPVKIKALRRRLTEKRKKGSVEKVIGELYGTIQEIKKYCTDAFLELFLIKKRDFFLTLKILLDLHNLRDANIKWARNHFIPNAGALEKNKEIVKIQTKISKDFHIIAQAFRIVISKIQKLEKEAEFDASRM